MQWNAGNFKESLLKCPDFFKSKKVHRYIKSLSKCDHTSPYLVFIIDIDYVSFRAKVEVEELVAELHKNQT